MLLVLLLGTVVSCKGLLEFLVLRSMMTFRSDSLHQLPSGCGDDDDDGDVMMTMVMMLPLMNNKKMMITRRGAAVVRLADDAIGCDLGHGDNGDCIIVSVVIANPQGPKYLYSRM